MRDDIRNDDIALDRLVDGELSSDERRRLLASLEDQPDGWRRCALAFLEAQSWKSDLQGLVDRSSPPSTTTAAAAGPTKPAERGLIWLAIAAAIMAAFSIGLVQSNRQPAVVAQPMAPDGQVVSIPAPSVEPNSEARKSDDALTFWVRDDSGQSRPMRVPLVDAGELDRELGVSFQSAIPDGVREHLQQRGYDVQSKRRYAPLWVENGGPMIVPVEDTKIVPVGQHVY